MFVALVTEHTATSARAALTMTTAAATGRARWPISGFVTNIRMTTTSLVFI